MSSADPSSPPLLLHDPSAPALVLNTSPPEDPPPPYPSARRTRQTRRRRALLDSSEHSHPQAPSDEYDTLSPPLQCQEGPPDDGDASETTPLLSPNPNSPRPPLHPGTIRRRRTLSLTSTLRSSASLAPSFAHTVFSAFQPERDSDLDPDCREEDDDEPEPDLESPSQSPIVRDYDPAQRAFAAELSGYAQRQLQRHQQLSFAARWRRYFRPLRRRAYYSALFHILLLNFPYALFSWLFLFVFTLVGTCTLMALPLGAVFCFIDLFGARLLSRGELALQTTFHGPLAYPLPSPPLPIFLRTRPPTPAQIEAGVPASATVQETSFYRNAYAMFTDPTSYQALFYFLVIKPGITVLMFLFFIVLFPISAALVLPLPAVLRLARRVGIWQANVAVEGLYFAAR
ncbi:hypothetical protein L227DRAFT_587069 [Lentinus tigrinus ALCF2SS1-6]|uniref:Sensor domain-containing protein n=1 Tax=Lentinus tigrinus ALCF2SS1-6 TaxID=1328759 RepID=A0A5C2S4R5_9APHY|nr:hypothetical protein L227DRAFT_587069 [Lentinus tigrinus ALCF2SS1-6]